MKLTRHTAIPATIRDLAIKHGISVRMTQTVQGSVFEILDRAGRPGQTMVTISAVLAGIRRVR